ncbi:DUF4386 domain-containing protein [Comamonas testosteroni]|uniref:DUF4386 domain-containing protein n=1 Tax=Comamonas testosteroni TaxID=285 RepID=UPI0015FCAA21|nr:DUF4386 domain-containing protein [Comamonas testosteroni]
MNRNRTNAKISGYALILMALTAGFAIGFAFPKVYDKNQLELLLKNFTENYGLYKQMLVGLSTTLILDFLVSWTLFQFFKNDNRKIALTSFLLRIIYTFIFGIATYYLFANLKSGIDNRTLLENYNSFDKIWTSGLIIFGGHLFAISLLMKLHKKIPKALWILTLIAGVAYMIIHLLKVMLPQLNEFTQILDNLFALPMALGEICLAIWLIIKGGKQHETKNASH